MGKTIKDSRIEYIEKERLLRTKISDHHKRVYEDHELLEFINDFFSQNRNIYANVKYTYPYTLEMYP